MIDVDKLLISILQNLDKDSVARKIIDKALEVQDYKYNDEGFIQSIHTNPLFAAFDDPSIFKIGTIIRNKESGITATVTTYLDGAYSLSNGSMVLAKDKDNWEEL